MIMTTKKSPTTKTAVKKPAVRKPATPKVAAPKTVTIKRVELTEDSFVHEIFDAVSSERIGAKKVEILSASEFLFHTAVIR